MKTFATAQMFKDDQGWVENLDLTISFQIPEIWTDIDLVPYVEKTGKNYKKLSNIEEYVLKQVEIKWVRIRWYDWDWAWYDMNPLEAMMFVIDTFYSALDHCSRDGRKPFHVNIEDPKSKIKAYGEEWKWMMDQLNAAQVLWESSKPSIDTTVTDKLDQVIEMISKIKIQPTEVVPKKKSTKPQVEEPQINTKELDMSRFNPTSTQPEPLDLNNLIPQMNEDYAIIRTN